MDGVIATNTTLQRQGLVSSFSREMGGLSGAPLFLKAWRLFLTFLGVHRDGCPLSVSGGIANASSARAMLDAGATLVQVYTGLIYQGPGLVKQILSGLQE